jgi:hypothetical protein
VAALNACLDEQERQRQEERVRKILEKQKDPVYMERIRRIRTGGHICADLFRVPLKEEQPTTKEGKLVPEKIKAEHTGEGIKAATLITETSASFSTVMFTRNLHA